MAYINGKKILQVVKTEFTPAVYQEKTITPQTFTPEVVADSGYAALSKVKLKGVLVDPHESYTTQTDSTIAYQKTTPTGALKYASLDKVGGMSYKSNTDLYNYVNVQNGGIDGGEVTTYTIDANDITITDRGSANYNRVSFVFNTVVGNKYTISLIASTTARVGIINNTNTVNVLVDNFTGNKTITFTAQTTTTYIYFYAYYNVPTTFTNIHVVEGEIPYFEGIRNSAVTSVVSKDSNDTTLDTLTIPSEVQALTGYGMGLNSSLYNYIDFETKKFMQNVNRNVFNGASSENWQTQFGLFYISNTDYDFQNNVIKFISNLYTEIAYHGSLSDFINSGDKIITITEHYIYVKDTSITSIADFKTYLSNNNLELIYALKNTAKVETDISEYIDNNFIEVEPNGTTTFNNTYNQAVPSEVTYLVEESNG